MTDVPRIRPRMPLFMRATAALLLMFCVAIAAHAAVKQRTFPTPDQAVDALVRAVKARDRNEIIAIIGPGSEQWLPSANEAEDRERVARFIATYEQKYVVANDNDKQATLTIGPDDWPFAFPIVRSGASWRFDTEAGKKELLARRIGENELSAINVMLAIVDAQKDYARQDRNGDGRREYARKFASSEGSRDGLYWPTSVNDPPSPLGAVFTQAALDARHKSAAASPYHGYYFRMLTGQGPHANGGKLDYIAKGRMIGGFAAIAYPAQYRKTGVMTFIVSHDGVVYQKDLGGDTAKHAQAITRFDPAPGWTAVSPP